jgi:hypothetical protein
MPCPEHKKILDILPNNVTFIIQALRPGRPVNARFPCNMRVCVTDFNRFILALLLLYLRQARRLLPEIAPNHL